MVTVGDTTVKKNAFVIVVFEMYRPSSTSLNFLGNQWNVFPVFRLFFAFSKLTSAMSQSNERWSVELIIVPGPIYS